MFKNIVGKKILVTGHTGFKGSWLVAFLSQFNTKIIGISLKSKKKTHFDYFKKIKIFKDYRFDIRQKKLLKKIISRHKPQIIFHLAAQSLVSNSYTDPIKTWETNLIGTINILDILKKTKHTCQVIIVTSDKCYRNVETKRGYKEDDVLGGEDPYSASKASAEIAINSFFRSFLIKKKNISIVSCRAGNVVGGGDWSKDRIVPDCIKSWMKEKTVSIRNPKSTRPWQFVLEPINGYVTLANKLVDDKKLNGHSFNFGPKNKKMISVIYVVKALSNFFGGKKFKIIKKNKIAESNLLKLNSEKAKRLLNWQTKLSTKETLRLTAEWYKSFLLDKNSIEDTTLNQISSFLKR